MQKTNQEKEAIITEYLLGNISYRQLGLKHGVDFRVVHSWVKRFKGIEMKKSKKATTKNLSDLESQLPTDVKQLQEELRKAKLHIKLLDAMIDISEKN
ncbi:MAG TPA: hypothetical protein VLZ83_01795 [Edaphocola sp.]|nr:hypothetical protein [Edaphocola sp.]